MPSEATGSLTTTLTSASARRGAAVPPRAAGAPARRFVPTKCPPGLLEQRPDGDGRHAGPDGEGAGVLAGLVDEYAFVLLTDAAASRPQSLVGEGHEEAPAGGGGG